MTSEYDVIVSAGVRGASTVPVRWSRAASGSPASSSTRRCWWSCSTTGWGRVGTTSYNAAHPARCRPGPRHGAVGAPDDNTAVTGATYDIDGGEQLVLG